MTPEIPKRPGRTKGNLLTIVAATLGILAADAGTKPVQSALQRERAPSHSRVEPGYPSLRKLKELHNRNVVDESMEVVDAIVTIRGRFKGEYVKVQPRLNKLISGVSGNDLNERTSALKVAVVEELDRLNKAPNAERIQTLAGLVLKSADALQEFIRVLDFSQQSLTGQPLSDGPSLLLDNLVHDEEYRVRARKAIAEAHTLFESDAHELSDAFYRAFLLTLQTLRQPPQPAKPEPKDGR